MSEADKNKAYKNRPMEREEAEKGVHLMSLGNPRLAALFSSAEIREKAVRILMEGGSIPVWEWAAQAERKNTQKCARCEKMLDNGNCKYFIPYAGEKVPSCKSCTYDFLNLRE